MAQSVIYADLKFSTAPDEDDSPYENVTLGQPAPAAPSTGCWLRRWRLPVWLLAATLLLLLLVATVALGACYWQVTRRMQDTSREHVAEQGRLSQEVSDRERSLEQARLELAWARAELQRAWSEGNGSRAELGRLGSELERVTGVLGRTQKELQELQGQLNSTQDTVSRLRACVNTDCCPPGWVLYRSKCLFISVGRDSWVSSDRDCRERSSQLLVRGDWPALSVPHFLEMTPLFYWIGGRDESQMSDEESTTFHFCPAIINGKIGKQFCSAYFPWICEKSPNLSSPFKTISLLPDKW
ncbi:B-cell differentiation antigen CD72-like isoform X2 [Calypte anna]|uniref:B-cell differentiation antigen CD72-like isoform X2 n=1 Tax=Calypte anna TaxID=9244 RepID=UPI0011C495AE|nr:B-cell differentiation antigen CD72-like isoform X2 [Calypte anna]